MKNLVFSNSDNTLVVDYLTDLIGEGVSFTIYQIKTIASGVETIGLSAAAIALGFWDKLQEYTLGEFKEFAETNTLTLTTKETGVADVVVYSPIYGGDAIGGDEL